MVFFNACKKKIIIRMGEIPLNFVWDDIRRIHNLEKFLVRRKNTVGINRIKIQPFLTVKISFFRHGF